MNIAFQRLASQQLLRPEHASIAGLVHHMTAMQAQDFVMSKWAIGVRLPGTSDAAVMQALERGEIIRTHVLRPTWHWVAAGDLRWLLALSAPHVRASMVSRHRELEITPALETRSRKIIAKEIGNRGPLTREEIAGALERGGIVLGESRLPHLLMLAELDALICSGPVKGARPSFALVDEHVPARPLPTREESLMELARRYLVGHGPATLRDFAWWSGLPVRDARQAIASVSRDMASEEIDGETYWFTGDAVRPPRKDFVCLHPAYDEFLIAYVNRSASLPADLAKGVVSSNGIFRAVATVNGRVIGLWSRELRKASVSVAVTVFDGTAGPSKAALAAAGEAFASFIGKPLATMVSPSGRMR